MIRLQFRNPRLHRKPPKRAYLLHANRIPYETKSMQRQRIEHFYGTVMRQF